MTGLCSEVVQTCTILGADGDPRVSRLLRAQRGATAIYEVSTSWPSRGPVGPLGLSAIQVAEPLRMGRKISDPLNRPIQFWTWLLNILSQRLTSALLGPTLWSWKAPPQSRAVDTTPDASSQASDPAPVPAKAGRPGASNH